MITTISKRFCFDAAHFLPTVPEGHKCRRMHGHTYAVELVFKGRTAENGFCAGIDYGDIATIWERIEKHVDHRVLNDVPGLDVPSTENLVVWVAWRFAFECQQADRSKLSAALHAVRIAESSTTWCEFIVEQSWRKASGRKSGGAQ